MIENTKRMRKHFDAQVIKKKTVIAKASVRFTKNVAILPTISRHLKVLTFYTTLTHKSNNSYNDLHVETIELSETSCITMFDDLWELLLIFKRKQAESYPMPSG